MNERFKELEKQATTVVEGWSDERGTTRYYEFNREKFAELIIRECASLTLDPMQIDEAQYYHGWLDYRDEILKHFGVA